MCLAVLALRCIPGLPVLIAANRDEFHARPTAPAARWPGAGAALYAGRDLQAGGTWMGATDSGRYALVTNYREPGRHLDPAPSRGALVEDWLQGAQAPAEYIARLHEAGDLYNGFNLIIGDASGAWYYGNRGGAPRELASGVHAVSNHLLDTPWPKLMRTRRAFEQYLRHLPQPIEPEDFYALLHDTEPAGDEELPATGLPLARERLLSSPFIVSPDYGTRCSTVLALHADGRGELHERRYDPQGRAMGDSDLSWRVG
jgi:uncharacterized protein with NRDE domain